MESYSLIVDNANYDHFINHTLIITSCFIE